jgi:HEPN domain-containing protein
LKGAIVEQRDTEPPRTHDLVELADLGGLELTQEQRLFLTRLTDHSVRSRYPGGEYEEEDVRQLFAETKEFFEWLREKLT